MQVKHSLDPARSIIAKFGGCRRLGRLLGISFSTVSRWAASTEKRGTGGRIPQRYWEKLILEAAKLGFVLTPKDLSGL